MTTSFDFERISYNEGIAHLHCYRRQRKIVGALVYCDVGSIIGSLCVMAAPSSTLSAMVVSLLVVSLFLLMTGAALVVAYGHLGDAHDRLHDYYCFGPLGHHPCFEAVVLDYDNR